MAGLLVCKAVAGMINICAIASEGSIALILADTLVRTPRLDQCHPKLAVGSHRVPAGVKNGYDCL